MSLKSCLAGALALAAFAAPAAAQAAENGPAPTVNSIRMMGTYAYDRIDIPDSATPGFGAAYLYAPKDTSVKWGAVAIAPGWTETSSAVNWFGPRLASHGFAVIVFNVTNTLTDLPSQRASQLLRALDYLTTASPLKDRVDATRTAVSGHSMGGGGALEASLRRPSLKAAVPLEPWNTLANYKTDTVPTFIVGAQNDIIAPVGTHARKFYATLPDTTPKAYFEYKGGDHFVSNTPNQYIAAQTISWFKRFIDGDTRYSQFLHPFPTGVAAARIQRYESNGPF